MAYYYRSRLNLEDNLQSVALFASYCQDSISFFLTDKHTASLGWIKFSTAKQSILIIS